MSETPRIDPRTAPEIAGQLQYFLEKYTGGKQFDLKKGAGAALINIFARYAELIIERLNKAPEKNFLAFLDLLGVSPRPPQPARVPLTFTLAEGSAVDTIVPAGTQVAAATAEGEPEPVIFETESELVVTAARLSSIFIRDPENDGSTDWSISSILSPDGVPVFQATRRRDEHVFYLGQDKLFGHPHLNELTLTLTMAGSADLLSPLAMEWEIWDEKIWRSVPAELQLLRWDSQSGYSVKLKALSTFLPHTVNGLEARWLRCRLVTPIPPAVYQQEGKLPVFRSVEMQATLKREGLSVESAVANDMPVDVVKGFFPFGERPKVGDTLYLAHKEAFKESGAKVTLHITVANSPRVFKNLTLSYEFWDGKTWTALRVEADGTSSLTKSGDVIITIPKQPVSAIINGVESFWIRIRIAGGNYGEEAHFALKDPNDPSQGYLYADADLTRQPPYYGDPAKGYKLIPATYAPPLIGSLALDYNATRPGQPEIVLTYNDFAYKVARGEWKPFEPQPDTSPTLYLGFELPAGRKTFPQRKISIYADLHEYKFGDRPDSISVSDGALPGERPQLEWEYSTGTGWAKLLIRDGTESFTQSGLVEFFGPADFARRVEFGLEQYWVRVVWKGGQYIFAPRLRRALLNTTMASQTVTLKMEILGSSDGSRHQRFQTTRAPVLEGQLLEVREPEQPSALERNRVKKEAGGQSVTASASHDSSNVWVRWTEVADFYGSGARDRHYIVDHLTGEVRFGDGARGMIPPTGSGNLRLTQYKTGGGAAGNKPAGTIAQLKTTVPYVESVTNHRAASGGADAETLDSLLERAPHTVRNRDRAVTLEDYEDLARLASPEVARALCVPLFDLAATPQAVDETDNKPGMVSLIIVPRSTDARPVPGIELIDRVRSYLDARRSPTSELVIVGPEYISVGVHVEVALTLMEGASEVEMAIAHALARFLHPLTGGWESAGWDFGRKPHKSDLYALIEEIAGVGHVHSLTVTPDEESDQFKTDRFLISSGKHEIKLRLEEA